MPCTSLLLAALLPAVASAQTVVGTYIFHRHGDRTAKAWPPANLTDLGYDEVYMSGEYYRSRYVTAASPLHINGLSSTLVNLAQVAFSAPADNVLMSSAMGFTQALYPAVGGTLGSQMLRNGSTVQTPLNGYQLIPIATTTSGAGSEDSTWLQASTNCANAITVSNDYYYSPEYMALYNQTLSFYQMLEPVINTTYSASQSTYKNAYAIFDYLNVANIHNQTIPSSNLLTADALVQLQSLANVHELNLAYNATDPISAVAGMTLAAQITQFLNSSSLSAKQPKLGVQFGNYATFQSFFGLADMLAVPGAPGTNDSFVGIPDYASSMVFELYTDSAPTYPVNPADLNVRFLFHNGTATNSTPPSVYPLFGSAATNMSWTNFTAAMSKFSISNTQQWCSACGNTTGSCAPSAISGGSDSSDGSLSGDSRSGSGISNAVAGVIGAMVTLGVILLVEGAIVLLGGLRLVRKNRMVAGNGVRNGTASGKA